MALTSTEEAQTRALIAQNAALLSLASNEAAIISELGAGDVTLADLPVASSLSSGDLLLVRQGTTERSAVKSLFDQPLASETVSGIVELATVAEAQDGIDATRAVTPAGLAARTPSASTTVSGLVELATTSEAQAGTDVVRAVTPAGLKAAIGNPMESIDYTLAANALTLKLNPTTLAFRSTTLTSGTPTLVSNAAQITTTISSGSTGGTISAVQSDILILAINNAGTMELAWTNIAGGVNLDETTLINTTAEGGAGAADSAAVIYSTTARTGVAFRVVGIFRSTQTTAGTWAQTPGLVQPIGGQALAAMSSLGYSQKWTDVLASRAAGTTYYNTTGRPIGISIWCNNVATTGGTGYQLFINGVITHQNLSPGAGLASNNSSAGGFFLIPPGASYSLIVTSSTLAAAGWLELR